MTEDRIYLNEKRLAPPPDYSSPDIHDKYPLSASFITTTIVLSSRGRHVGQSVPNIHRTPATITHRNDSRRRQSSLLSWRYALLHDAAAATPGAHPAPSPTGDGANNSYCCYRRQHRRPKTFWPTASVRFARPDEFVFRIARGRKWDPPRNRPPHLNALTGFLVSTLRRQRHLRTWRLIVFNRGFLRVAVIFFFPTWVYFVWSSSAASRGFSVAVRSASTFFF